MTQQGFLGLMDMFDGGGAGASGSQFKGGPVSGLLNSVGINPYGTQAKLQGMQDTRPQARPPMPGQAPQAPQQPAQRPPAMPQQPMQYGPQNGRGAAGPAPVGRSGPQPMQPTEALRMQYGPPPMPTVAQPMPYGPPQQPQQPPMPGQMPQAQGGAQQPSPESMLRTPEEIDAYRYMRSMQQLPY